MITDAVPKKEFDGNSILNPNQFSVFGFVDTDLGGPQFVPQRFHRFF